MPNKMRWSPRRKIFSIHAASLPVPDKLGITVDWSNDQNREKKIISKIKQETFVLNSSIVALDRVMDISKNVVRHSQRNYPIIVYGKQNFCRDDKQN